MTTSISPTPRLLALLVVACSTAASAQTLPKGKIISAATTAGAGVMDPNRDNFVSKTAAGFVTNDQTESEIAYVALPQLGVEPSGDIRTGANGGVTDLVDTATYQSSFIHYGKGVDGLADTADDRLLFRMRIGKAPSGAFGYSMLIDTDLKIGFTGASADPNAVAGNPGFEIELIVATGGNGKGVNIYDVDGRTNGVLKKNYPLGDQTQQSLALTQNNGDDDVFLDYFILLADLKTAFALTPTTRFRITSASSSSPSSALGGSASDVNGIDDNSPAYATIDAMFIAAVSNTPVISLTDVGTGGGGFNLCGNGVVNADEICDDGNGTGGDGCAADCKAIDSGYCCIGGGVACVAGGALQTAGGCAQCVPATSRTAWSPAPSTTSCRAADGGCDTAEACSGTSLACPANALKAAGFECRPAAGACDVAESCSGSSAQCPGDLLKAQGFECRAATGDCDVAESCTGGSALCPGNLSAVDGTGCNDGDSCTTSDVCAGAVCGGTPGASCVVAPVITSPATGTFTRDTTPTIGGTGPAGARIDLYADGLLVGTTTAEANGAWSLDTSVLAPGSHLLTARATLAGRTSGDSAAITLTVDLTAPETTIPAGPAALARDPFAAFTLASSEPGTFECRLDNGVFAPCTAQHAVGPLADGPHRLDVRATDDAGNVDATPASHLWTLDSGAPQTFIDAAPAPKTSSAIAVFEFSSSEPATLACRVDAGEWLPCPADATFGPLDDGPHVLDVRATDPSGNVDATPATAEWLIDTTPPETFVDIGPPSVTSESTASFTFSASEPGVTYECRVDQAAFAPCTSGYTTTDPGDGEHVFEVRARDAVGNTDASPARHTWRIDATPPETTIEAKPDALTRVATASFTFGGLDAISFECSLDGAAFAACDRAAMFGPLLDGSHELRVRGLDALGNVDPTPAVHTWKIDTTPPTLTVTGGPGATTTALSAAFTLTANEPDSTFACSLDGAEFAPCAAALTLSGLEVGAHALRVRATDPAGNTSEIGTASWTIVPADTDGDGLTDVKELEIGTDPNDTDTDDDGVIDGAEPQPGGDTDGDGLVNALDPDSDDDGLADGTELGVTTPSAGTDVTKGAFIPDADPATTTDPTVVDTDGDGLDDGAEDPDHDGMVDPGETPPTIPETTPPPADSDGDGLTDAEELVLGTNPNDADTDDDGLTDGAEANPGLDSDGDGLVNALDPDSDDDGLADGTERGVTTAGPGTDLTRGIFVADADPATKTNAMLQDTDGDGRNDGAEDANHDGKVDAAETDPNVPDLAPAPVDSDGDGLTDVEELFFGTDPDDADTDDDGVLDGAEPNPGIDTDRDGLVNALDFDSDGDGLNDGLERGLTEAAADTDVTKGHFQPDADPATRTNPLLADTDRGGVADGLEDLDHDGAIDAGETDPTEKQDDPINRDRDGDSILDADEPGADSDGDGVPDALDLDSDGDGVTDRDEAGDGDLATPPIDTDDDGLPDFLDVDSDGDGVPDASDDCRFVANADQADLDGDGLGDACTDDRDGDGTPDAGDNCPSVANGSQADLDADGLGDACDADDDGDGFVDEVGVSGGGCGNSSPGAPTALWLVAAAVVALARRRVRA